MRPWRFGRVLRSRWRGADRYDNQREDEPGEPALTRSSTPLSHLLRPLYQVLWFFRSSNYKNSFQTLSARASHDRSAPLAFTRATLVLLRETALVSLPVAVNALQHVRRKIPTVDSCLPPRQGNVDEPLWGGRLSVHSQISFPRAPRIQQNSTDGRSRRFTRHLMTRSRTIALTLRAFQSKSRWLRG